VSRIVQLAARTGAQPGAPVLTYVLVLAALAVVGAVVVLAGTPIGRRFMMSMITRVGDAVVARHPDPDRVLPAARMAPDDGHSPYSTGSIPEQTTSGNAVVGDAITSGAITMGNVATATGIDRSTESAAPWWSNRAISVLPGRPLPRTARDDAGLDGPRDETVQENSTLEKPAALEQSTVDDYIDDGWPPAPEPEPLRGNLFRGRSLPAESAPKATLPTVQPTLGTPPRLTAALSAASTAVPSLELGPIRELAPVDPAKPRRTATKKQQALLVGVDQELAAASGQRAIADITTRSAVALVGADNTLLVLKSISGPAVLAQYPDARDGAQIWGVRTLGALLMRPEPIRLMIDGDPLADGARTAVLTAPIVSGGDLVGVLVSRRMSGKAFTAYDEAALSRLARACGSRLPSSPERELLVASNMDRVTGLANRDLLINDLRAALTGMVAHGMPATLLVGEVDGLARLRTTKGSVAAGVALAELAAKVRVAVRFGDAVYRSGSDELAVLLPATDESGAAAVGQRLTALAAGSFESTHPGLSLRTAAVEIDGSAKDVLLRAAADLGAARVAERWAAGGAKVV
jgi:diguanylate cyclase (GGDEF)-like protein